jgi:hypothetical protein
MRLALAVVLTGCTSFDPTFGPLHVEQPSSGVEGDAANGQEPSSDAATDAAPDGDAGDGDARAVASGVSFRRDIRPLMNRAASDPAGKGCKNCHYSTEVNHQGIDLGGLDLATLGALREGGGSSGRRIVVPGKPEESALVQKFGGTYPYGTRMPKNGPPFWSDADVKLVTDWIAEGAKGADDE